MKKFLILLLMVIYPYIGFSQSQNNQFVTVKQLQSQSDEIKLLKNQIDSLSILLDKKVENIHKECHNDCNNYYNRLDNELDRTLSKFSWIWGLFGVIIGIIVPLGLNIISEKNLVKDITELKDFVTRETENLKELVTQQIKNQDRITASRFREQYKDIDKQIKEQNKIFGKRFGEHKAYIDKISTEVETYEKQSKINSLISEAQLIFEKDPEKAIPIYTEVLALDTDNETALLWRGIAFEATNKYKEALADLNHLVEINPQQARAYNNIANVYSQSQLHDKALLYYNKALELNPMYAIVYGNLGLLYEDKEELDKAIENLNKAIELDDNAIKFFVSRRRCYTKKLKQATSDDDKARLKSLIEFDAERIRELQSLKLDRL